MGSWIVAARERRDEASFEAERAAEAVVAASLRVDSGEEEEVVVVVEAWARDWSSFSESSESAVCLGFPGAMIGRGKSCKRLSLCQSGGSDNSRADGIPASVCWH